VRAALAKDFVSSVRVVSVTVAACGELPTSLVISEAYPAVRTAPKIDCIRAPPRSRWRSAVPDAMPARVAGTESVRERAAGVCAKPTPTPTRAYPRPTVQ